MSAVAVDTRLGKTLRFYSTTVGKKVVMAVTGVIGFGFLLGHLAGNLQMFLGREVMNHYAVALRALPALLIGARTVLLLAVILHIVAAFQLLATKNAARPVGYVKKDAVTSSYASRTMYWSGPIIGAFILFHLAHFTWGIVHPDFKELMPYDNVIAGFKVLPITFFYIVAMVLLGMHLNHGLWSLFQSLGFSHPKYTPKLKMFAVLFSVVITAGFLSIPVAVLLGIIA
jgi:succinate dehydrogenase / fumarate reductase cytochrome b subunit